jgi:hypothetical protein
MEVKAMYIKIIIYIMLFSGIFIFIGCRDRNSDSNIPDTNEVINEVSEAIETSTDYLSAQSQAAIEAAAKNYTDLESDAQKLISEIKNSGADTIQDMGNELDNKLTNAKQKLENLQEASEENYQKATDAYNVAIKELKDAYQKAKTEYEEKDQQNN